MQLMQPLNAFTVVGLTLVGQTPSPLAGRPSHPHGLLMYLACPLPTSAPLRLPFPAAAHPFSMFNVDDCLLALFDNAHVYVRDSLGAFSKGAPA